MGEPSQDMQWIHERLRSDCHLLLVDDQMATLLHRNATLPWFIVVPRTDETVLFDVEAEMRQAVLQKCDKLANLIREDLGWPHINFATIGNVVAQLHVHVVGRRQGDACWPKPVWGNLDDHIGYSDVEVDSMKRLLQTGHAGQ